jgi:hypothetical protein
MTRHDGLYQWTATVATALPHLSVPQARVLALWSFGMVLARSCALTAVTAVLAELLGKKDTAVRQCLREWCYEAKDKRGQHRQSLDVHACFVPLLRWVIRLWQGQHMVLALDATHLAQTFIVLAVSVVYRGCAIPVAWVILPAMDKGAWRQHWLRLLRLLRPAIPRTMVVVVTADRGLYARWLFRRIVRLGWHPFLRINVGGTFRPDQSPCQYRPLASFAPQPGMQWKGTGVAFKNRGAQLRCTLLAYWLDGMTDAWLILTDLPPSACDAAWYGLRAWIEQGFKVTKRGGWQWQRTRMTDPERAARLWLAVSVATLWLLSVGEDGDGPITVESPTDSILTASVSAPALPHRRRATCLRLKSVFRRGWCRVMAALLRHDPLPAGRLIPEIWPTSRPLMEVVVT